MDTKFTPGPWVADGSESTTATWVNGADGKRVCTIRPSFEDWGNARLIAAAPELLEAINGLMKIFSSVTQGQEAELMAEWLPKARAAIAKATGG